MMKRIGACIVQQGTLELHLTSQLRFQGKTILQLTDWYGTLKHLKPDFAPFTDRLKLDTSIYKCLSEISSTCTKGVGSDSDWSWRFVSLKESNGLWVS